MTIKINAAPEGEKVRNLTNAFPVDPAYILVTARNGRAFPHDEEAIAKRCKSFEQEGQLQAVVVRKVEDNKLELVAGYCRHAAALLFNKLHPDTPMKLNVIVKEMNDEEAFRKNIVENQEREGTTPVDDAFNQRRLREEFHWIDARIAEFYGCNPSYVSQLKKLLTLETKIQIMVHKKRMALQAALALADLSAEDRLAALAEVESSEEGVSTESVTKAVRERKISKGKGQARTLKNVRDYFEGLTGPAELDGVQSLGELMLKFIGGKIKESTMTKRLNNLLVLADKESAEEDADTPKVEANVEAPKVEANVEAA